MGNSEPLQMKLLLVEDDLAERNKYSEFAKTRDDIQFVLMTGSSDEAITYMQKEKIDGKVDGVILDLELHKGKGSGLAFLKAIDNLPEKPIIIVATNTQSDLVYHSIRGLGVDFVHYKKQVGFSPEAVVEELLFMHSVRLNDSEAQAMYGEQSPETEEERAERVRNAIDAELELVGVSSRYKGRRYLLNAIYMLVEKEGQEHSVINEVVKAEKVAYSTIVRAMQTAINYAWETISTDELAIHYTARINKTGVPTPTEFIYYYAGKVKKQL